MGYREKLLNLFETVEFGSDAFFIDKVLGGKNIVLYGAGESSHWFVEIVMKMYGIKPVVVLDRKFSGKERWEDIEAVHPDNYAPSEEILKNPLVVICIGNNKYYRKIYEVLEEMGFVNIISLLDIYEIHNPFNLPVELAEEGRSYFFRHKKDIMKAFDLLEDDLSKEIYYKYLKIHMERVPTPLPKSPRDEQYFPKDVPLSKGYSRFINCGAYDGDVVSLLNSKVGKIDELICFEPEPGIYKRLTEYLFTNRGLIAHRINSIPCAVYDKNEIVKFKSGFGLGSRISHDGDSVVQAVSLDSLLPDFKPDFMCMDVEGVEPDVLKGAEKMIKESRVDLGICVYHSANHIWLLMLYLNMLNVGYKFYLRNYTSYCIETVLYATGG